MNFTQADHDYMAMAIALAKQGFNTTTPNPNVGCVIVKEGEIVGQGFHVQAGGPHAEVFALREAAEQARGATAYVTLEPCSHYGRTPPCAKGLIDAGVSKVICAMVDPNPEVAGNGLKMLQQAGIETASGLLEQEARALNKGFLKRMEHGLPYVVAKLAASLDGKTALQNGKSKWITGPDARRDVQAFRAKSCAILSGADTVLTDNARLNVRAEELPNLTPAQDSVDVRQPLRIIIDTQNRLLPSLALFESHSKVIILRSKLDNQHNWPHFVEQVCLPTINNKLDLKAVLSFLASRDINLVWLEAGATLCGVMHEQGLIDEYIVYFAPKIIGDDGKGLFKSHMLTEMDQIQELQITDCTQVGNDIRISAIKK
ncbi:bifunctional diaminohydroxyphosphoribosylaminopyrimidine deaminase/5-amino-6-(5-phosphoribosylamino)uracil reductase RibD [Pseudoalteromonas luteoviolacea]|uniref:bifunctional diaminohydroxyphosphoribosylaminopyrimidine deaminase/5-amino-6-(5-phosphoribosylamino)uracil reductase RibD n=1 Tax=Pseudoalteromonas luteoviolacea TaxID=43657 RepID=UPI001B386CE7|nr:bifunctional diaminohydroxyphosphoribosylaminopyrimidine deaminase/5-amino-6-(5-phosphoribosylamino)uracil reductase RibD [Pseudoalteromonas luteoviolacea]MBQ4812984.1 bifunctional diaminohydroxyphosphoribosylaminopyrimidine deaminase/5-amino-6-(5-phosphoribosylamino)uracil reductase RibD [Pseudoalteromonas luteoviolacea]